MMVIGITIATGYATLRLQQAAIAFKENNSKGEIRRLTLDVFALEQVMIRLKPILVLTSQHPKIRLLQLAHLWVCALLNSL